MFTLIVFSAVSPVSAAEDEKPSRSSDVLKSGVQKLDLTRYTLAGKPIDVMIMWDMNPADCGPMQNPSEHEVTKEPEHGTAEVVTMTGHANFASDAPASKCNGKTAKAFRYRYRANDGYQGTDEFQVTEFTGMGIMIERTFHVNVRGPGKATRR